MLNSHSCALLQCQCLTQLGQYTEAELVLVHFLLVRPSNTEATRQLARVYGLLQKHQQVSGRERELKGENWRK